MRERWEGLEVIVRVNCEEEMGCVEVNVRVCGGDSEGEL